LKEKITNPINIFGRNIWHVTLFNGRQSTVILLLFCILAVILRFFSFFPSVIDHDESTYLEIARMLLSGRTLYVDMTDIKPPGIFLILAGFQAIFGYSIFVIRLLVSLWIALTAYIIYLTAGLLIKNYRAAIASGIIYILFISTWSFYGISITPEIFFNLFTVLALYVLHRFENPAKYILAGLIAGLGFIVKYLVIFDFAAFILFFIFSEMRNEKSAIGNAILKGSYALTGFLLPFGIANLWYYLNGHWDAFYNITYLAPSKYPAAFDPRKMLRFIADFHLRFLPLLIFYYYALFQKGLKAKEIVTTRKLVLLWSVLALLAVLIAGKTFGHYMIQLMLPVSLVSGLIFHSNFEMPSQISRFFHRKAAWIGLLIVFLGISAMKLEYVFKKDVPREVASYLESRLKPDDIIYAGNYHHIIYYLLKKESPTKYIHRSLLIVDKHIRALNINVEEEFRKIKEKRPLYIIVKREYPVQSMQGYIDENYILEMEFEGEVRVFRRLN
jgi:4-amino-4-deoxy-L-arabinose transferase-like glycosyltransferase